MDIFDYLASWAEYQIADKREIGRPTKEYDLLLDDCNARKLTPRVKKHLENRSNWAEMAIPYSEKHKNMLLTNELLGQDFENSPIGNVVRSILETSASEADQLPFELKGLKQGLKLFKK